MIRLFLIFCLYLATPAPAEVCLDYTQPPTPVIVNSGMLPAEARFVAGAGDRLCWAEGTNNNQYTVLHWCLIGNDGDLQELGSHRLLRDGVDYACRYVQVDGKRVLVSDWRGSWQVIDFAAPAAPLVAWEAPPGAAAGNPVLRDRWLYVPTSVGLALFELEEGQSPHLRSLVSADQGDPELTNHGVVRLALEGDLCWAITTDSQYDGGVVSLLVIDYGDPAAPAILDRLPFGSWGEYDDESVFALAADRGSAILTRLRRHWNGRPYDFNYRYDILFFDREAAGQTTLAASCRSAVGHDAAIAGDRAWVSESGGIRYFERSRGRWLTHAVLATGLGSVADMVVRDEMIWASSERSFCALPSKVPDAWPAIGRAYEPDAGACYRLAAVAGNLVTMVYDLWPSPVGPMGWGFVALDPADPRCFVSSPLLVASQTSLYRAAIVGDHAYTHEGIWDLVSRARVNATSPDIFGATGTTLWGRDDTGRLSSWDGTDPGAPVLQGTYFRVDGGGQTRPIFATAGELAFFASRDTVIAATTAASPLEPVIVDRLVTGLGAVNSLALQDGMLYIAQEGGLAVVAVDPDGRLALRGLAGGPEGGLAKVAPDGRVLYALTAYGGQLQVFDVGDPELPRPIAGPALGGNDLLLHGNVLYVVSSVITAVKRQCALALPVAVAGLEAAWRDGAAHLTWRMDGDLTTIRVLARAAHREWVVPWQFEAESCLAVDDHAPIGHTVDYAVQVLADDQWLTIAEASLAIPGATLALSAPTPNPFNAQTTCEFALDAPGFVELSVLDAAGRLVRTLLAEPRTEGHHQVVWRGDDRNGRPVAAGAYLIRLTTAHGVRTVKTVLVK